MRFDDRHQPDIESLPAGYHAPASLDRMGATASLLCAIHCAAMPLVITLLPLVGLGFLAQEWMEWILVGMAAIFGVTSLCLGYREHRSRRAFFLLAAGLTCILLGRVAERNGGGIRGVALLVVGGCTVAGAHILNRYLCRTCRHCASCKATGR